MSFKSIDLNPEFQKALDLLENSSQNLLICGKAGTGKSTFLNYFRRNTWKKMVVLAPTGVAAINVDGVTIHSFFRYSTDITLDKLRRKKRDEKLAKLLQGVDVIVIDEISMVRADLLDCIDLSLRKNGKNEDLAFGGIQMVFIGDLYQIPPVVSSELRNYFREVYASPYFFSSDIFQAEKSNFTYIEFEKIYRQSDRQFIDILNAIRNNTAQASDFRVLNQRYQPDFEADPEEFWVQITGTNAQAQQINEKELAKLPDEEMVYPGEISGDFKKESCPADLILKLKEGAQVMLLNNDSSGDWVNGSIGIIQKIQAEHIEILLVNGKKVRVSPHTWDLYQYVFDEHNQSLKSESLGSFTQYPIRLAWAMTVHKSQGKTFEKLIVDLGFTFTPGQMYVALSRATSMEGLVLKKPLNARSVFIDYQVSQFLTSLQYQQAEQTLSFDNKLDLIEYAIKNRQKIEIVYLKTSDVKSQRVILPTYLGDLDYQGKPFFGIEGLCMLRNETRNFRVDRILEIKLCGE